MSEERVFECPAWFDGKKVDELMFYTRFVKHHQLRAHNGQFFSFNGRVEDEQVKCMIAEALYAAVHDDLERRAAAMLKSVRMFASQDEWNPDTGFIHVKNGTLDVSTRLFSHDRRICQARMNAIFNPGAEQPRLWLDFLSQLLEPEDILTLQEYLGYCLIPSTKAQKMLILIGRGGEGKSCIGYMLKRLLGTGCCNGSIRKIETNRFAPASLEGRLVMVDDDLDMNALPSTNTLKTIVTAETPIDLERKGVQSYQGILNCRFICFGNGTLTSLYDHSDGFYRRQIVLHTRPRPADRVDDPYLAERFEEELEGILLWCLEGLKRLQDNDYRFTLSENALQHMQALRRENNNILDFIQSSGYIRFDPEARITSAFLYDCYRRWCEDNTCRPFSAQRLVSELREHSAELGLTYSNNIPIGGGKRVRGFRGIASMQEPFGSI